MKKIYTCFCTDVIHEGHLNIINEAKKYGDVYVGVMTDAAMVKFSRFSTISFEERIDLVKGIEGVKEVLIQDEVMYDKIVDILHPDYVIHGDNWKTGPMKAIRDNVVKLLSAYGGEVIDVPYTYNENVKRVDAQCKEKLSMPEYRRKRLKQLLKICPIVKTIEVHSGLTGLIAEKTIVENDGAFNQFDAMWISSLCDSTAKGKPDIELVDMTSRFRTIDDVMEVTTKPIIFDGDTGGLTEHFVYTVRSLERMGVSAVIIEDKTGLKKNSLFGTEVQQTQDTIENFCEKISAGKKVQLTDDLMIIARVESLILERGMDDALTRAHAYVKAGADGIMIHSRKKDPAEILEFCDKFRAENKDTPIVVVPSSFNTITEDELSAHGVNIVIYA
ncbi:MAG: phosphoenolpyruvate mutase, partial [Clostridiales bacterium]|nr:phosphoenolpyruvate mutase [Clostridiales bacterium]